MKFDEVLEEIGGFGKYQKWIFFLTCPPYLITGFFMLNPVVLLGVPLHRCAIPGFDNDTYEVQDEYHQYMINLTIPQSDQNDETFDRCTMYVPVHTQLDNGSFYRMREAHNYTSARKECNRWVYDKSVFKETFASQKNLICGDELMVANAEMALFGGMLLGSLISGIFADKYGRKIVVYVAILTMVASSLSLSFAHTYLLFVILEFILGAALIAITYPLYTISLEITGTSKRMWPSVIGEFPYIVGVVLYAAIAYAMRDWFWIEIITAIPGIAFISYWWLLPESPRWLLSKGRVNEAEVIIRRAAKWNEVTLPARLFDETSLEDLAENNEANVIHLFSTKTLCFRTCLIFFNWTAVALAYYGLPLNMSNIAGDMYLNFGLLALVEIPAVFVTIALVDRIGRRRLYCCMMVIGGTACVLTVIVLEYGSKGVVAINLTLTLVGKLCVTVGYTVNSMHSAELFPTVVRNAGLGAGSMCARIGTMIAPYIINIGGSLPLVMFGSISIISGVLSLLLPETLNRNLPETLEDAEHFGKSDVSIQRANPNQYRDNTIKVSSRENESECEHFISEYC